MYKRSLLIVPTTQLLNVSNLTIFPHLIVSAYLSLGVISKTERDN